MNRTTQTIRFTKMQGVGNDFIVVDARTSRPLDWAALAREVCDRRFGIGADGLLVIETSHIADVAMRMYNPDGTPDICGNGLRCVARYVLERRSDSASALRIATLAGVRQTELHRTPSGECRVTVDMGKPRFDPTDIPMRVQGPTVVDYPLEVDGETFPVTVLSTGTAHAILFVEELPDDGTFFRISPRIEHHYAFPERTSLMWTRVENSSRLRLRIWERAAGETWGCGTGACAAAVAAILHAFVRGPVTVASRGGELVIDWKEGKTIRMSGPAEYVFEGVYPLSLT